MVNAKLLQFLTIGKWSYIEFLCKYHFDIDMVFESQHLKVIH